MTESPSGSSVVPLWNTREYLDGRWNHRVSYSDADGGFAFRPGHFIAELPEGTCPADLDLFHPDHDIDESNYHDLGGNFWLFHHDAGHEDGIPLWLCRLLEILGFSCEPNYVLFGDTTGPSAPHPSLVSGNPVHGNPVHGNPVHGNPVHGNPVHGNPVHGNYYGNGPFMSPVWARPDWGTPVYVSPLYADRFHAPMYRNTGRVAPGVRPALGADVELPLPFTGVDPQPKVIVLDTGLAPQGMSPNYLANLYGNQFPKDDDLDQPDTDNDFSLDPIAGHGTFIAGIIQQLVPGVEIETRRVLSSFGDGDVAKIHVTVDHLLDEVDEHTIVNMSFSGYLPSDSRVLTHIVKAIQAKHGVVVASAGNDGFGRPSFPAAIPGVIGVGGLGAYGPAAFTNWGPWLRACAPAVDLTSCFYANPTDESGQPLPVPQKALSGMPDDLDSFQGWSRWTGTSFAAPIVAAALAREMIRATTGGNPCTAAQAVETIIDGPDLMRIPNLGAIVNLCPPLPAQNPPPAST